MLGNITWNLVVALKRTMIVFQGLIPSYSDINRGYIKYYFVIEPLAFSTGHDPHNPRPCITYLPHVPLQCDVERVHTLPAV